MSLVLYREKPPAVDFEGADKAYKPEPGHFVVQMAPIPERASGVIISQGEHSERRNRPDVGTVLAVGAGVPLLPGDVLVLKNEHGKRVEGCQLGDWQATDEVRFYGAEAQRTTTGIPNVVKISWRAVVFGDFDSEADNLIHPRGTKVLIEREDVQETVGGIYLPDSQQFRSTIGTVLEVGGGVGFSSQGYPCDGVEPGQRVVYLATAVVPGAIPRHLVNNRNLAIIDRDAILGVIQD